MRYPFWRLGLFVIFLSALSNQVGFAAERRNPSDIGKRQSGIASTYDRSSGKDTASGEALNESALTAAHRTLPLNTVVVVTNDQTGRKTVVRINDRGPFVHGRIIDLTPAAARALGVDGLGRVSLEVVSLPDEH
jgi:rare lipoprotein A